MKLKDLLLTCNNPFCNIVLQYEVQDYLPYTVQGTYERMPDIPKELLDRNVRSWYYSSTKEVYDELLINLK